MLTERNKSFLNYSGTFGILISLTCLIQHFIYTRPHYITYLLAFVYLYSVITFCMLIAHRAVAYILLIINCVLSLAATLFIFKAGVFTLIVMILFLYSTIMAVVLTVNEIPRLLKQHALFVKSEEEQWRGRI